MAGSTGLTRRRLLPVLGFLAMFSPLATDMYLPSLPAMARDLDVSASTVQLTLTLFLLGGGVGQLVFGPLSDRYGRRAPLLIGSLLCLVASVVVAIAPNAAILNAGRFAQGFAGVSSIVIARAIVADVFEGPDAARSFSLLGTIGGLGPIIAPVMGGLLAEPIGWRGVMWVIAALVVLMIVLIVTRVPETHPPGAGHALLGGPPEVEPGTAPDTEIRTPVRHASILALLRRRGFTANALMPGFGFIIVMGYVAASPFVFQDVMGLTPLAGALLFGINAGALLIGNLLNMRLVRRHGQRPLLRVGVAGLVVAAVILGAVVLFDLPVWALEIPFLIIPLSMGMVFGNSLALALSHAADGRGAGSAFAGSFQFAAGAAVAPLVGIAGPTSVVPLAVVVVVGAVLCVFALLAGEAADPVPAAA